MTHPAPAANQAGKRRPYGHWDTAQDAQLLLGWAGKNLQVLSRELHRSPAAVRRRAYRLLLTSHDYRPDYSLLDLSLDFGVDETRIRQWVFRGWLRGYQNKRGGHWSFEHADVRAFIVTYPDEAYSGRITPDRRRWLRGLRNEEDASQYLDDGVTRKLPAPRRGKAGAA